MGVSKNRGGPPKSSILIGFSTINHPFSGTPIFGNTQINTSLESGRFLFGIFGRLKVNVYLEPYGHPFISGCFNWMIPILYIGNGCFTKHPFQMVVSGTRYIFYSWWWLFGGICGWASRSKNSVQEIPSTFGPHKPMENAGFKPYKYGL